MNITLTRTYSMMATEGTLAVGDLNLYTIEKPWADNKPKVSCVPEGTYDLIPYDSPTHGMTWCVDNAKLGVTWNGANGTRGFCEFHAGNFEEDSEGCILLGMNNEPMLDPYTDKVGPAINQSRQAVSKFLMALGPMTIGHTLVITKE